MFNTLKWETCPLAPAPAKPYVGYRTAIRLGHFVVVPGYSSGRAALVFLDINTNEWRCDMKMGACANSGEGFLQGDSMLWLGRRGADGETYTTTRLSRLNLSTYDFVLREWSTCPTTGPLPSQRYGFAGKLIEVRNRFVVFGGNDMSDNPLNDVHLLDIHMKRWIQPVVKGNIPSGRVYFGSCVQNGLFYCYGGIGRGPHGDGRYSDGIYILKVSANDVATWSKPKVVFEGISPFELSSFAMTPFQGKLLLIGGMGTRLNNGIRVYDPKAYTLSNLYLDGGTGNGRGLGYGISAVPLENDKVFGIFGIPHRLESYVKMSVNN